MSTAKAAYERVSEAAKAHTRLNTFGQVVAMLEGGCLPSGCASADKAAQKIITLCKAEMMWQLDVYDRAARDVAFPKGR